MEVYLNIAEWGPGIFGAEAAAERLFGRPAAALGVREATLLAAALPNPIVRNAARPGRHHARLAAVTGARLAAAGGLTGCLGGGAKKSSPPG
jgi:monofunctional biosynthetic peptidoglycan transglycosylase